MGISHTFSAPVQVAKIDNYVRCMILNFLIE